MLTHSDENHGPGKQGDQQEASDETDGQHADSRPSSTQVGYGFEPGRVGSMVDSSAVRRAAERVVGDITVPEAPFLRDSPSLHDIQQREQDKAVEPSPLDKIPSQPKAKKPKKGDVELQGDDEAPSQNPGAPFSGSRNAASTAGQALDSDPVNHADHLHPPENRRAAVNDSQINAGASHANSTDPPPLGSIPDVPAIPSSSRESSNAESLWEVLKSTTRQPEPLGPVPRGEQDEAGSWDLLEESPVGSLPPLGQILRQSSEQGEHDETTKVKTHRVRALDMSDLFTSPGDEPGLKGIFRLSSQSLPILDDEVPGPDKSRHEIAGPRENEPTADSDDEEPTVVWGTADNDAATAVSHEEDPEDDPRRIGLEETVLSHPSQDSVLPQEEGNMPREKPKAPRRLDTTKWSRNDIIAGKYQVEERIGSGGMAKIFKVVHRDLGKSFALKIIHSSLSDDASVREMFYREARLASSMEHPNVVQVTDFGEDSRFGAFIVMEYLQGETLHARLNREGPFKVPMACEIMLQVAEALYFIHSRDVVHCDIKSENIFLVDTTTSSRKRVQVKLLDFGLSAAMTSSSPDVAASPKIGGTPAYLAPERIRREPPTPKTDIYALGVLFYEIITASLPFSGDMEQTLMGHLYEEPTPPSHRTSLPIDERIDELILKALSKNPDDRQKDMGAFIFELRTAMHMLGINTGRHRAIAARATSLRANRCESVFDAAPIPLFQVNDEGVISLANGAFSKFLNLPLTDLVGTSLMNTKLGRLCPELGQDLDRVMQDSVPVQRLIVFPILGEHHPAPHRANRETPPSVLVWLVPLGNGDSVKTITGVIHPYSH